jgi:hypothetical protein
MQPLTQIYYFPIDREGRETGIALPIQLKPNGSADISQLPSDLQNTLNAFGVPNNLRSIVFPRDGKRFLEALLHQTNGYRRFRQTSTPSTQL